MKYLKKYSTEADRQAATAIEPSASIVVEDEGVYYDRAWDTPTEVLHENKSPYWTWDWQFIRPAAWPNLDIFDMEHNYGIVATYDCRDRIADPANCRDYFVVRCHNTLTYVVERGTVINGEFVVRNTVTLNQTATYSELLPTNEGDYVVYRITIPSWPSTNNNFRFYLTSGSTDDKSASGDYIYQNNKILELLVNCKVSDVNVLPYSKIIKRYKQYNNGSSGFTSTFNAAFSDLEFLDVSTQGSVTSFQVAFSSNPNLKKIKLAKNLNIAAVNGAFSGCYKLEELNTGDISVSGTSFDSVFRNCTCLKNVDISNWNAQNTTTMTYMFDSCRSLEAIDVSSWSTPNLTGSLQQTFYGCSSLENLDLSSWDFSKCTNCTFMFGNCTKLKTVQMSNSLSFAKCTTMNGMFQYCFSLIECPLSGKSVDTSKVTVFGNMFLQCFNLSEIDASRWDFTAATSDTATLAMFSNCYNLKTVKLSSTISVMGYTIFNKCYNLESIIIYVTTPPTWAVTTTYLSHLHPNYKIYVPDASVETYKTATGWLNAADHIYGISTYTGD